MDVPLDYSRYIQVLRLARQPSQDEFLQVSKIAGAGIILVGVVGFLMYVITTILPLA